MRTNNRKWAALAVAALMALPGLADADSFHDAVISGDVETVRALLDAGADVEARTEDGHTALMLAAAGSHEGIVRMLLDAGADVNARDEKGWTALMWPAFLGHEGIVRALLDAGADVNARDNEGYTPLQMATVRISKSHTTEIAALLRAAGARE